MAEIDKLTVEDELEKITCLSIKDRNAVSKEYDISSLYVFCPRNRTPSSMSSQMINRRISPRYRPEISFCRSINRLEPCKHNRNIAPTSNACSPCLLDVSSMMISYFVLGKFSCSNESNAPYIKLIAIRRDNRFRPAYPLAIDGHLSIWVYPEMLDLGNVTDTFHICCIAPGPKDACNACLGIDVMRSDECTSRVAS